MPTAPHDISDLFLAPVALEIDRNLSDLGKLDLRGLALRVALESDRPDHTREQRESGLLTTVTHLIDMRGWAASWDPRGLRLSHAGHTLVLGVPATFERYLAHDPAHA